MSIGLEKMLIDLVFFIISLVLGAGGLRITHLSVPNIVDVNTTAVLTCLFDLENGKLYSVKWYKDNNEFFRYMPALYPETDFFQVDGVNVDIKQCNMTSVTLQPLKFNSSGTYTCEVSSEAPHFKTIYSSSNLTVLGIPKRDPIIEGIKEVYSVGDFVEGNCTSDYSYPPAEIEWFINDNQVENWQLKVYSDTEEERKEELKPSILGVSFQADNSHFSGKGYTMHLKCVARVGDIVRSSKRISSLADIDTEKYAQSLYRNSGSNVGKLHYILVILYFSLKS